jgi:membrane dipeptidase
MPGFANVRDLVGIDHVGLGPDFDGSTTTGFDVSQIAAATQALLDAGFPRPTSAR